VRQHSLAMLPPPLATPRRHVDHRAGIAWSYQFLLIRIQWHLSVLPLDALWQRVATPTVIRAALFHGACCAPSLYDVPQIPLESWPGTAYRLMLSSTSKRTYLPNNHPRSPAQSTQAAESCRARAVLQSLIAPIAVVGNTSDGEGRSRAAPPPLR
jgi:hypothetical protein